MEGSGIFYPKVPQALDSAINPQTSGSNTGGNTSTKSVSASELINEQNFKSSYHGHFIDNDLHKGQKWLLGGFTRAPNSESPVTGPWLRTDVSEAKIHEYRMLYMQALQSRFMDYEMFPAMAEVDICKVFSVSEPQRVRIFPHHPEIDVVRVCFNEDREWWYKGSNFNDTDGTATGVFRIKFMPTEFLGGRDFYKPEDGDMKYAGQFTTAVVIREHEGSTGSEKYKYDMPAKESDERRQILEKEPKERIYAFHGLGTLFDMKNRTQYAGKFELGQFVGGAKHNFGEFERDYTDLTLSESKSHAGDVEDENVGDDGDIVDDVSSQNTIQSGIVEKGIEQGSPRTTNSFKPAKPLHWVLKGRVEGKIPPATEQEYHDGLTENKDLFHDACDMALTANDEIREAKKSQRQAQAQAAKAITQCKAHPEDCHSKCQSEISTKAIFGFDPTKPIFGSGKASGSQSGKTPSSVESPTESSKTPSSVGFRGDPAAKPVFGIV